MAVENETPVPANTFLETFLLNWEGAGQAMPEGPLMYLDCKLSYGSKGTDDMLRTDRGRIMTAMDGELLRFCEPRLRGGVRLHAIATSCTGEQHLLDVACDGGSYRSGRSMAAHGKDQTVFLSGGGVMERAGMQEYFGDVRAYFAPVNRVTETGTVFDPSLSFNLKNPPSPWVHVGLVRNFKRDGQIDDGDGEERSGRTGADAVSQAVDARVSLDFCEWGKLQMALAASSQHMNVLESASTQPRASGGAAKPGQPILAASTATLILLDPSVLGNYQVGELIVVDMDYTSGIADFGTGITGGVAGAGAPWMPMRCAALATTWDAWPPLRRLACNWVRRCWEALRQAARGCRRWWHLWTATGTVFCRNGRRCLRWRKPAAAACTSTIRDCRRRLRRQRRWRSWQWNEHDACCTRSSKPGFDGRERRAERGVLPLLCSGSGSAGVLIQRTEVPPWRLGIELRSFTGPDLMRGEHLAPLYCMRRHRAEFG